MTRPCLTRPCLTPPCLTHPVLTHPVLTHPVLTRPCLTIQEPRVWFYLTDRGRVGPSVDQTGLSRTSHTRLFGSRAQKGFCVVL